MNTFKSLAIVLFSCLLFSACEKKDSTIIDPVLSFPSILKTSFNPATFDTSIISAITEAKVSSDIAIKKVTVTVKNPSGTELGIFELKNDGILPDTTANDSIYTGYVSFTLNCRILGIYRAEYLAENTVGLFSPKIVRQFNVINTYNHIPFLSDLMLNHELRRPSGSGSDTTNYDTLHIQANDPDGNCDIKQVFFNSYNPRNFPSRFNPFIMYDDGNIHSHGDPIASDYQYSLIVEVTADPSDTSLGYFKFHFYAQDNSDSLSHPLIDSIFIHR